MTSVTGAGAVARILGEDAAKGTAMLDILRDPETGAHLALVRADGPVTGLPEGQTTPLLAIVDTGLDSSHPWIAQTLVESVDLTGQGEEDHNGHGTRIALLALWSSPEMPVGLLNVKALGDDGTGTVDALARGIRWAARRGATRINISAGVRQPSCRGDCPLCRAALDAAAGGIKVSAAAGNVAGETTCPAKAGLAHPESGVAAGGALDPARSAPQPYSGIGNYYLPSPDPVWLPTDEPVGSPKYRAAYASTLLYLASLDFWATLYTGDWSVDFAARRLDEAVACCGNDGEPEVRVYAAMALLNKGFIFRRYGRPQDEFACYRSVIERYGADPAQGVRDQVDLARLKRAEALERLGDTAGALADYGAILGDGRPLLSTQSWRLALALFQRGLLLGALGRREEASADLGAARGWFEKPARAGSVDAMVNLGVILRESEPEAARGWFEKAAQTGADDAMVNLGVILRESEPETARGWFEKAAQHSNIGAMYHLGVLLQDRDAGAAQGWFEKAAQAGHTDAMNNLGVLLQNSEPGAAQGWFEKAAQAGHTDAMYNLGILLHESDPTAARDWFEKAAQAGHTDAMYNLGVLLHESDPTAAQGWYEKAAQAGHTDAMTGLGVLLYDSEPGAAQGWFEKAAQAGNVDGMNNLGILLRESDPEAARDWFEKAARAGHTGAMNNLGALLAGQ